MTRAIRTVVGDGPVTVLYVQPTSEIGGSDVALLRLVTNLDRARFRPVVVLPRDGPLVESLRGAGVAVRFLPMRQLRPVRNVGYQARFALAFWPTVFRIARLVRSENALLVHSNSLYTLYGAWAARVSRRPHVWHVREIPDGARILRSVLARVARRRADRVVPMTHAVAGLFGPPDRRPPTVIPIPDGIDLDQFHPSVSGARIRAELGIASTAPVVGFVARLDPWKGAEVFVRAAAEIARERPDAHFIVSGGELPGYESYAAGVRELASGLGLDGRSNAHRLAGPRGPMAGASQHRTGRSRP